MEPKFGTRLLPRRLIDLEEILLQKLHPTTDVRVLLVHVLATVGGTLAVWHQKVEAVGASVQVQNHQRFESSVHARL